jgi:signal transduction histidine kinase
VKLVNRVSVFFLAALAVVLAGYSLLLYTTVRDYLHSEFDNRLSGALQILSASVEVEPEDVTWFPEEYTLDFEGKVLQEVRWLVADERGRIVDQSPKLSIDSLKDSVVVEYGRTPHPRHAGAIDLEGWRIMQRLIQAPHPQPVERREFNEYGSLLVTVAMSHVQLDKALARLAGLLTVLPIAIWSLAALVGRTYVGRSLHPLRLMVDQAEAAAGAAFDLRLPTGKSGDELSELSAAFNRLLDQLQGAFERERRFSSDAAHQLRTPLTILQGELDVVLRRPRRAEEYVTSLQKLTQVVAEMRQVVESLLFLARSDQDATAPKLEPIDLSQWLPLYAQRWSSHPRFDDLEWGQLPGPLLVETSASLLSQVLDNLIENALVYSPTGSQVEVQVSPRGENVEIAVRDHGMGVAPEHREAIFEPFFRDPRSQAAAAGGSGLGLSVARRIARCLGGSLECRIVDNRQGSLFVLILPNCPASNTPPSGHARPLPGKADCAWNPAQSSPVRR